MIWNVGSRENQVIKGLLGRRKAVVSDLSFNMNLNANAINGVSSKHLPQQLLFFILNSVHFQNNQKSRSLWNKRTLYGSPFSYLGPYLCSIFQSSLLSHYDLTLCSSDSKSLTLVSLFFYPHLPPPTPPHAKKKLWSQKSWTGFANFFLFVCLFELPWIILMY